MAKALERRDGKPTAYGFACGAVYRRDYDMGNRVELIKIHHAYHVRGFERGAYFGYAFRFNTSAWREFREISSRMHLAKLQGKIGVE